MRYPKHSLRRQEAQMLEVAIQFQLFGTLKKQGNYAR
jgi:hypothetical protein